MCFFAKFVDLWVSGENMVDFVGVMLILIQGCASSIWISEVDDYVWRVFAQPKYNGVGLDQNWTSASFVCSNNYIGKT